MARKLLFYFILILNIPKIYGQSVDLLSPNGNENWSVGSIHAIQWSYSNINFVKLDYSVDGGVNFINIVPSYNASANIFYWTIPANVSTNCIVKISDYTNTYADQSDNPFTISNNPYINLTDLNGGEVLTPGTDTLVTWTDFSISANVKIEYSGNGGLNWILIVDNYPNTNSFVWTVPNTPSNNCLIKVSDSQNNAIADSSNAEFIIAPLNTPVVVVSPNGGESWPVGYQQVIQWTANNVPNIKIEISYDNGALWNVIENNYPAADGYYFWLAAAPFATNTAKLRISDAQNPNIADESDFPFSFFLPAPTINLIYPIGGESIADGIPIDIFWSSVNMSTITIEYSINNGLNWQLITSNADASLGHFTWTVPNTPTNAALIRLTDNNNTNIIDQSASPFSIITAQLSLQNFPNGLTFDIYSNLNINWSSLAVNNQPLTLEYSIDNGLNWILIANNIPNTGLYQWLVNCPPTDSCKIKISLQNNPNIFDISAGAIRVIATNPTLVVLTPTSQEVIGAGSTYAIKWFSYAVNYVRIELSINGDTIFNLISAFVPAANGIYYWQVPANLTAINCRIKISNAANTNLISTNLGVFSIQPGNFNITSGNITNTLIAGSNHLITWNSFGTSNYVNLSYSIDSINWIPIVNNYINNGNYNWSVPYIISDSVRYKITDVTFNTIYDINDLLLKIIIPNPLIELVSPTTGSNLITNSTVNISWNTGGIDSIRISYSENGGANWTNITNSISTSDSSFIWNTGSNAIVNGLLRISNSNDLTQYDQISFSTSNPDLTITSPNGGESLNSNSINYITWQSTGVNYINLYYSINNGGIWNVIDTNILNIGYHPWMTSLTGSNFLIKITNADIPSMTDESDAIFSIVAPGQSISLLSPVGNEVLTAGTGTYIDWQTSGISNIDILYSLNGGSTYLPIASNIPSVPSYYYWQVPDTISNLVKIKINKSGNTSVSSASASNFSIVSNTPNLQLLNANGGEILNANTFYTIQWNANNCDFVKLFYSLDGGTTFVYINSIIGSGSFVWNIPMISSTTCKIKICHALDSNVFDISDSDFQINNIANGNQIITIDSLAINTFCSGTNFTIGYTVSNNFNLTNNFRVQLSNSSGSFNTFTDIGSTSSTTSGNILCHIPHEINSGSNYSLRIVADNPPVIGNAYAFGNIIINRANADFLTDNTLLLLPNAVATLTPITNNNLISNSNWMIGNGITLTTYAPQINFYQPNKYHVLHEIIDVNGCSDSVFKSKLIATEQLFYTETIPTPNAQDIVDIAFENARYGCAIFKNGNCIITSDSGKTWHIAYTTNNNIELNSLQIHNNNWLIAMQDGSYLKSIDKGNTWSNYSFNNNQSINDMIYTSNSTIIAVCNSGKIKKYNGSIWQNQNSGTDNHLNNIDAKNNTLIIVGDNATILKYQNNNWLPIQSPVNTNLNDVIFKDSLVGFIAADFGYILKSVDGGLTWSVSLSGADIEFKKINYAGDSLWAIGTSGIIYTSNDNGDHWERFSIGTTDNLNSMVYINQRGFIAGSNGLLRTFNNKEYIPVIDQLKEANNICNVKCFPNPTTEYVIVDFNTNESQIKYTVTIKDINGKQVYQNQIFSSYQHIIDFKNYNAGIYLLSITSNSLNKTYKIIKTN